MKIKLKEDSIGCFTVTVIFLLTINAIVGTWSIMEILSWFNKSIPLIANFTIGLFMGEFSIPVAIVGKILKICGIF